MTVSNRLYSLLAAGFLAATVLLAHGWCLDDGTVLDDYWHQKALRENGWSLPELQRSLVIEPSQWMHHWWQDKPVRWEYARPLFIVTMKLIYHVFGGDDPWSLHAYSLLLHFACATMVWRLCLRLTRDRFWSVVAGLLFVVYPHAVMTVQWSSSQNCVQQAALCLAALLAYARASGLNLESLGGAPRGGEPRSVPRLSGAWTALSVGLWLLALLTKENAIVLPVILLAFDWAFGGRAQLRRRLGVYAAFLVLGAAFAAWRASVLTTGMPDVYFRRPAGDVGEYVLWCGAKFLHYLCTSIWLAPMMIGPTGRFNPWIQAPRDCAIMLAIVGVLTLGYAQATRGVRGRWIWPLWIVLAILPVVPVIATAHSGYFGGVGFAIAAVLGPAAYAAHARGRLNTRGTWMGRLSGIVAIFYLVATSVLTMLDRWQWTGVIAAERYVPACVQAAPPPPTATDVFFLNLPFVNIYVAPALSRSLGPDFARIRAHVLTYAPQPVLLEQRSYVEQLDDHSFALSIVGQPYFSRLLGRFLIEGFRREGPFQRGQSIHTDDFDVRIVDADVEGVHRLVFTFPRPLDDPHYCFYLTSIDFPAARLQFRGPLPSGIPREQRHENPETRPIASIEDVRNAARRLEAGHSDVSDTLWSAVQDRDSAIAAAAMDTIHRVGGFIAQATGSPMQDLLMGDPLPVDELGPPPRIKPPPAPPPPPSLDADQWRRVSLWWRQTIDDQTLAELWLRRHDFDEYPKAREEVPHARQWAALAIRTDLYLTGPPFPGPKARHGGTTAAAASRGNRARLRL